MFCCKLVQTLWNKQLYELSKATYRRYSFSGFLIIILCQYQYIFIYLWGLFKYYLLSYKYFVFFSFLLLKYFPKFYYSWFYELCASDSLSTLILKSIEMGSRPPLVGSLGDGGTRFPGGWRCTWEMDASTVRLGPWGMEAHAVPLMLLGLRPSGMRHAGPG